MGPAMETSKELDPFHPAVRRWFGESFAAPTPAQALGWPPIARGEHTLILAPTGSGKTLAAFLFALNDLCVRLDRGPTSGVHTLYLSPLKALAADIERNLEEPLRGIRAAAAGLGSPLREIVVGVRTGDTPAAARERMRRRPPHVLVTTPESLHLLLTSPRAAEGLRAVRYVIVDEIHAVCETKRGTFLSLLLERLEELVGTPFVRIGLSATQRPLDLVARFLGGYDSSGTPRPVTLVDAGARKDLDLEVVSPVEDMTDLPRSEDGSISIWPAIYERLLEMIESHRSTLIFANNRRSVERIAAELNRRAGFPLVRAHHGSVAKERRREIEEDLKTGRLPALVATGSLELGIDMGAIDLVCQVESTHSVARGLQRVGRAGHLYRATSKGRLIPKTRADLLEMAALARAMRRGETSAVHIPRNPLDILAQQVVAMVAVRERKVDDVLALARRAFPYHDLGEEAFLSVVDMVSGGFRGEAFPGMKPRISWDRVNGVLYPLPGSRHLAITNGGAISDTGQYPLVLEDGKTRLGELDEEFVYERREGETILLGTGRWRIVEIESDRVVVAASDEKVAQTPFWKGEGLGKDVEFGRQVGAFSRECESRLREPGFEDWLREECSLDAPSAKNLRTYVADQVASAGVVPSDRVILLDAFPDELGRARLAVLTPFGRAFHLAFLFAALAAFRRRTGVVPLAAHSDVGILFDLGHLALDRAVDTLLSIRPEEVPELVAQELEGSAFFGTRFRQSAARALLLPRLRPGRRTPLWLQRLRARDLLELARGYRSFPIVAEAFRESLEDLLPVRELAALLRDVACGEARFHLRRGDVPSPFASSLLFDFTAFYLYESDEPKLLAGPSRVDQEAIRSLLAGQTQGVVFDPDAIAAMEERLQSLGALDRARDGAELVELLRRLGDLTEEELARRAEAAALHALPDLLADGRVARVSLARAVRPDRLVAGEDLSRYVRFDDETQLEVVRRTVATHATVTRDQLRDRYGLSAEVLDRLLDAMELVQVPLPDGSSGLLLPEVAAGIRRLTLSLRRRRARPAAPEAYARFLLEFQHVRSPLEGRAGLAEVLTQLSWLYLPIAVWPRVLAARVRGYTSDHLDRLLFSGEFVWRGLAHGEGLRRIAFSPRDAAPTFLRLSPSPSETVPTEAERVRECLRERGASFLGEIAAAIDRTPSHAASALWALIWAGQVTNDSRAPVQAGEPKPGLWRAGRSRRGGWAGGGGRWSLLPPPLEPNDEDREAAARRLLDRHGLLSRDTQDLQTLSIPWAALYPILTRWEWRGVVERGLFVSGLSGSQFAHREAAEALSRASEDDEGLTLLDACDPANPYGASSLFPLRHPRSGDFPLRRHPRNFLVVRAGIPVLAIENTGERLTPLVDLGPAERRAALALLPEILRDESRPRPIRVVSWDGQPAASSSAAADLESVGFRREDEEFFYYRTYLGSAAS